MNMHINMNTPSMDGHIGSETTDRRKCDTIDAARRFYQEKFADGMEPMDFDDENDSKNGSSLRSSRHPRYHLNAPKQRAPTALELLEASKKLYVQTEFLKFHRIDPSAPRLFRTDSEEELNQVYQNSLRLPSDLIPAHSHQVVSPPRLRDQTNGTVFCLAKTLDSSFRQQQQQPFVARKSAFKPIQKTPPRPPKNEALKKRQIELASSCSKWEPPKELTQSLPSYEEFMRQGSVDKQKENRPVPPPRRSLLKTNGQSKKENKVPPVALPRRRQTTTYFGDLPQMSQSTYIGENEQQRLRSQATSTTNLLAKSTPDLSLELLINSSTTIPNNSQLESTHFSSNTGTDRNEKLTNDLFVRPLRSHSQLSAEFAKPPRPPTNPTRIKRSSSNNVSRQSSSSFPSPDSSKDSGVCTTPEMKNSLQITSDVDFEEIVQRWESRKKITNPLSLCPIVEKATNIQQKVPSSTHSSTKHAVHELFDSQGLDPRSLNELRATSSADEVHDDSDLVSDFTSITAERKQIEEMADDEDDQREVTPKRQLVPKSTVEKPVSQFEKNARILRWIHGCTMETTTNC